MSILQITSSDRVWNFWKKRALFKTKQTPCDDTCNVARCILSLYHANLSHTTVHISSFPWNISINYSNTKNILVFLWSLTTLEAPLMWFYLLCLQTHIPFEVDLSECNLGLGNAFRGTGPEVPFWQAGFEGHSPFLMSVALAAAKQITKNLL